MFNKVMRGQDKAANQAAQVRREALLKNVDEIYRKLRQTDLTVEESVIVLENVKQRMNQAFSAKKISEI